MSFTAQKYAELLNKDDLIQLFGLLTKVVGTRKEAAEICGISRKTTYDWTNIGDLKGATKEKALDALIEHLPKETFQRLTERSYKLSREVAMMYLSVIRSSLSQEKNADDFKRSLTMLDNALQRYSGLLIGTYDEEIGTLLLDVGRQVELRGVDWHPKPSPIIDEAELEQMIPEIMESIESGQNVVTTSRELRAPLSIVACIYGLAKAHLPWIRFEDRIQNADAFVLDSTLANNRNLTQSTLMIHGYVNSEESDTSNQAASDLRLVAKDVLTQNRQLLPIIMTAQGR